MTKPQIKIYEYSNSTFSLVAIIDDYESCSFEHNLYQAGQFTVTINYNIPNAHKFERGLFIQFGTSTRAFGEITTVSDAIDENGKGGQVRTITGYDARYLFHRRVIRNLNNNDTWSMTSTGELCIRNLVLDQCGSNAETKRQLPITNEIPSLDDSIGKEYSVSESYSNLYDTLVTIATQSEIGWAVEFDGEELSLVCYEGLNRALTVRFDTDFESLAEGEFSDNAESFANTVYVGGKGSGTNRDIYEGEQCENESLICLNGECVGFLKIDTNNFLLTEPGVSPSGLDRFECFDSQSNMTTQSEYEAEALSMLTQYGQTLSVEGRGLVKSPYTFGTDYDIGDTVTIAFSGKSAITQILSITENYEHGVYNLDFSFGKPQPDLSRQLQLILKQIQKTSASTDSKSTSSIIYYTIPTDTEMPSSDVTQNTIGFTGDVDTGASFKLYLDDEKTGAKSYHVYIKNLSGSGKLTLTTGVDGASDLELDTGTYVTIIYVDDDGNVFKMV